MRGYLRSYAPLLPFVGNRFPFNNPVQASAPAALATFDDTPSNVDLSEDKLTATAQASNGGVRSTSYQTTGKYYFEVTIPQIVDTCQSAVGVVTPTGTYANMYNNGTNSAEWLTNSGYVFSNDTFQGFLVGIPTDGDIVGVAIDLDNRKAWFRLNDGDWNGDADRDPVSGNGGATIAAVSSFAPAVAFGTSHGVGDQFVGNFGQSPYNRAAPAGFENWPAS